ncbi:hypothetical protein [Erythrobacter sp.]|uniref:hypothetical protein n=1 Tax=Erythrobacter sp. TaxID=1042 RepID=UPI0025EE2DD3|nr:hypothetical protein [Erythrobacter sp.]
MKYCAALIISAFISALQSSVCAAAQTPNVSIDVGREAAKDLDGAVAFEKLKSLVGDWQGQWANGPIHRVNYRLTAGGSVLVETRQLSPTRESMTIYYLDDNRLLATHYCPQGNQPRLQLDSIDAKGRMNFVFLDGTNLRVEGRSHQHSFPMRIIDTADFERAEFYVDNLATTLPENVPDLVKYERVAADR